VVAGVCVSVSGGPPSNKRLQLTPNSSFQSIRGTVLAAGAAPQRWRSALLGAAEPHVRWAAGRVMEQGDDEITREILVEHQALPRSRVLFSR
jgi:hypothetical protein